MAPDGGRIIHAEEDVAKFQAADAARRPLLSLMTAFL
jgi:hypothetical protein